MYSSPLASAAPYGPTDAATHAAVASRPRRGRPAPARRCAASAAVGVVSPDSALSETVEGRLVARGRGESSAGPEERAVHGDDLLRRIDQQPRRPQVVRQIVAAGLQFGRQATVARSARYRGAAANTTSQTLRHAALLFAQALSAGAGTLGPITAATRQGHGGAFRGLRGAVRRYVDANTGKYHRRDSALSVARRRNIRVASGPTPRGDPSNRSITDCEQESRTPPPWHALETAVTC